MYWKIYLYKISAIQIVNHALELVQMNAMNAMLRIIFNQQQILV